MKHVFSGDEDKPVTQIRKSKDAKMTALKAELKHLLSQPLIASGISAKYITSGSRPIVDDLIAGESKFVNLKCINS
jgi:ATP-dependent RNA helicase DDX24/MAK5